MTAEELRKKFIDFFVKHGHKEIPSASLIPENDPSALFINSGMHPLVPYLLGEPHPQGKRLCSVQKCLRTDDIEDVGDTFHHTFFEMLGNWSLGDYFKEEAIRLAWEFVTQQLKLPPDRLSVSCFAGDKDAPRDQEAAKIWQAVGIPKERIYFFGKKENWWAVGQTGPCGPDTEIFYDTGKKACDLKCQPGCSCGKYFEIWNLVFMVYHRQKDGSMQELKQKNIDTGMGLERTIAVLQGKEDDYQTELFWPIIKKIEEVSDKKYQAENQVPMRIIADHLRAATFIIADGVLPSNKDRGYILRRLIRHSLHHAHKLGIKENFTDQIAGVTIDLFSPVYQELTEKQPTIKKEIRSEEERFRKTLTRGLKEFVQITQTGQITGEQTFDLYQTYGFPLELTEELIKEKKLTAQNIKDEFIKAQTAHQKKSRTAAAGKFKGGLADQSEATIKLHTATHLLHAALRKVLGEHVQQIGSNITKKRLRFDFSHSEKLTNEEVKKIEALVNQWIEANLPVQVEIMTFDEAKKKGALAFFGQRYPEKVKVYSIKAVSDEVCAGPHVDFTAKLGRFMIIKEESAGAGKRRIYARLIL